MSSKNHKGGGVGSNGYGAKGSSRRQSTVSKTHTDSAMTAVSALPVVIDLAEEERWAEAKRSLAASGEVIFEVPSRPNKFGWVLERVVVFEDGHDGASHVVEASYRHETSTPGFSTEGFFGERYEVDQFGIVMFEHTPSGHSDLAGASDVRGALAEAFDSAENFHAEGQ